MYELIQVGKKTYYIDCPSKMGIYKVSDKEIFLIDSGNDDSAAKKICKIIEENKWNLSGIINTHFHADHIGGNSLLQKRFNCPIYSAQVETLFINNTLLNPSLLYGGYPFEALHHKFLLAKPSIATDIEKTDLPDGISYISLKGHSVGMIGIKTSDDVWFLADSLTEEKIIDKYHVFYLYDIKSHLETLDILETLDGELYIPSHTQPFEDIKQIIATNRSKMHEIMGNIIRVCKEPTCFDKIMQQIFDIYDLKMSTNQYVLVGSTLRSYLSYLMDVDKLETVCEDNMFMWVRK